jgi:hypothetical protein
VVSIIQEEGEKQNKGGKKKKTLACSRWVLSSRPFASAWSIFRFTGMAPSARSNVPTNPLNSGALAAQNGLSRKRGKKNKIK